MADADKPVCWVNINKQGDVTHHSNSCSSWSRTPLYARPVQKPLTPQQLHLAAADAQIAFCLKAGSSFEIEFARAIERLHGIGV